MVASFNVLNIKCHKDKKQRHRQLLNRIVRTYMSKSFVAGEMNIHRRSSTVAQLLLTLYSMFTGTMDIRIINRGGPKEGRIEYT